MFAILKNPYMKSSPLWSTFVERNRVLVKEIRGSLVNASGLAETCRPEKKCEGTEQGRLRCYNKPPLDSGPPSRQPDALLTRGQKPGTNAGTRFYGFRYTGCCRDMASYLPLDCEGENGGCGVCSVGGADAEYRGDILGNRLGIPRKTNRIDQRSA